MTNYSPFPVRIPTSLAIALAVTILSPVTILTLIPALWHLAIASGTSGLAISWTPIIAKRIKSFFYTSKIPFWSFCYKSSCAPSFLYPIHKVLNDLLAIYVIDVYIFYFICSSIF